MSRNFELLRKVQGSDPLDTFRGAGEGWPEDSRRRLPPRDPGYQPIHEPEWLRAAAVLKKHWRPALLFGLGIFALVAVITFLTKPVYEPVARLEVDPPGTEAFSMQGYNVPGNSTEYVTTQAKNLQSDELALAVLRTLHLDRDPDFAGKNAQTNRNVPDVHTDSDPQVTAAENQALKTLAKRTVVNRDTASQVIDVTVGAHDPVQAATITNTLVDQFVQREYEARHDAVIQSSQWLQKQLDDIRARMQESNRALAAFQKDSGLAVVGDNQSSYSEQMTELSRQLMQSEADRIQLQAYLNRFDGDSSSSLPQISSNPVVQSLTQKLAEVRADITQNLAIYGKNHPVVKKLQMQADELQSQLAAQRGAILKDLRTSYSAAQAREKLMQSQLNTANRQLTLMTQYAALKKEADANTQLYDNLFAKIKESGIAAESKSSPIRVVDRARVLDSPTRPHRLTNLAIGLLGGILGGVVLAFLIEGFTTTLSTIEDVRRCIGACPVSVMPVIDVDTTQSPVRRLVAPGRRDRFSQPFLINRPNSPEAEALRGLYTAVRLSQHNQSAHVILVASPNQGEGKTLMSVNLALALAERGRTCIVDADLRKEGVARAFGIVADRGLADVLQDDMQLDEVLLPSVGVPNLTLLPTGSPCVDAARFIASSAMSRVIQHLRTQFDFVLIDSPPIVPFSDGRVLSTMVDGVLLVGRSGKTKREALRRSLDMLREVRSAPVIQVVLNAVEVSAVEYRSYYRYGSQNKKG